MILQLFFIHAVQGIITREQRVFNDFQSMTCQNGYSTTATITFSDSFANIPNIIAFPTLMSYTSSNPTVILEIQSITLVDFKLKITCPNSLVESHRIKWFAIDDKRIEVINEPVANPIALKQYPIQNLNTKYAIASILSIGYNGIIDISLSITELTSTHVTIGIQNANSNLLHLGYQIILTTVEIVTFLDLKQASSTYTSPTVTIQPSTFFIIALQKFQPTDSSTLRFRIDITQNSYDYYYKTNTWSTSVYPPNTLQIYSIKFALANNFLAMECLTARINKLFDMTVDQKPAFEMKILELSKVYNSVGSESLILNESIQFLNIHIFYKCPSNNTYGSGKIHNLNHNCHGSINSINIYSKYTAQANYKEISISVTSNTILIEQTLRNQVVSQQIVLKVEFLDT